MTPGGSVATDGGFVGRSAELDRFARSIAAARAGAPSALLIGGAAGMGKSTLVAEGARRGSARLLIGRCMRLGGEVVPLAPLGDLLRHLQRTAPGVLAATEGLERVAPWLGDRDASPAPVRPTADGVFAPVLQVLATAAADDVAVVAFEDLHWADGATWDVFELLVRNLVDERLVLVGTYRSDEAARDAEMRRRLAELGRLAWVHRIELPGLARDEIAVRVAQLTGGAADPGLVDSLVDRGEGNPFFTEELVRAHLAGERLPDVVMDLISDELRCLADAERAVIDAAAAIGREVSHELLARVVGVDELELEAALRSVIGRQLLVRDRVLGGYRFRHGLIGEAVYDELLPSQRTRLHRRIAEVLATSDPFAAGFDRAGQLAFHLDRAGDVARAFSALLSAADAAMAVAPAVALRQLERAFELWEAAGAAATGEDRCERLWQAAELATGAVGNDRAVAIAREAFRWGIPARGAAWAHERLGRYLWASGELAAAREEFGAAAALVGAGGSDEGTAATLAGLGQADLMAADAAGAERWCAQLLARVPTTDVDPAAWVMAARVSSAARAEAGDLDAAVRLGRAAVAAAPDAYGRAMATAYLGIVLIQAGRYREAIGVAADGGGDARLAGLDRSFGAYFDSEVVEGLMRSGRWDEADAVISRRFAAGIDAFHPGRARMLVTAAVLAARRGDAEHAHRLLADARARPVDTFHAPLLDAGAAEAHLALGTWFAAGEAAVAGWEAAAGRRPWWAVRFAMLSVCAQVEQALDAIASRAPVDVVAVATELTDRVDAAAAALDGVPIAAVIEVQLRHARATVSLLTGPDPLAWSDVAARWEELPDRWLACDARVREAEAWYTTGDAARTASALRAAHVIALEMSSPVLLGRVEAVSRRTRISVESAELVVVDERSADRLGLTPREAEVLALVAAGRTNRQIGEQLYVSEKTASVHVSNILRKLGVTTRVEAAAVAQRLGVG